MLVTDPLMAERVVREVSASPRPVIDFETTGVRPFHGDRIVGICTKASGSPDAYYLPIGHLPGPNLPNDRVLYDLWKQIRHKTIRYWNGKFDMEMGHAHGLPLPDSIEDGMLGYELINENVKHAMKWVAQRVLGPAAVEGERELIAYAVDHRLDPKADLWKMPSTVVARYGADDAHLTDRLIEKAIPRLEKLKILGLWHEYNDYWRLLTRMEIRGLLVDMDYVDQLAVWSAAMEQQAEHMLALEAGKPIKPHCYDQVRAWLGVESSAEEVLETLTSPGAQLVLKARKYHRQWALYCANIWKYADACNVLHPNILFARTGRLRCAKPPLHSTPHNDDVFAVKRCFVARPGHVLKLYDYSQIESRLACHYSRDPRLTRIYQDGLDIHTEVSNELGMARREAKPINYGAFYGMGKKKLARNLHIPVSRADQFLTQYHTRYPGPRALYKRCTDLANRYRFLRLWSGRLRHFDLHRNDPRKASNSLLQGGAAEVTRVAMQRLEPFVFDEIGGAMLLQVHDSIMFEIPEEYDTPETDARIRHEMERDFPFRVPMVAEPTASVPNWGATEE